MKNKLKEMFNYRKRWKHQKNRARSLRRRNRKLAKGLSEELKLDITNEEIHKLSVEVSRLKKQVIKANQEAQKYFEMLIESNSGDSDE